MSRDLLVQVAYSIPIHESNKIDKISTSSACEYRFLSIDR